MIVVIDYGSGNLRSVAKAVERVGGDVRISSRPDDLLLADRVILPGVGAFGDCRKNLESAGLLEPVLEHVRRGKPFLGICVGMQLLFSEGHEFGIHPGLNLIPGRVIGFEKDMPNSQQETLHLKIPHMGWNQVRQTRSHPLWRGIDDHAHFYFVHSFHGVPDDMDMRVGESFHGVDFCAAVARDTLFATQFHPEKSQKFGLQMLENFIDWSP